MIRLQLPIYQEQKSKGKVKNILISMNNYRNWHYQVECKMKHIYHQLVKKQLDALKLNLRGKIKVSYNLYYKNSRCDLMNVISVIDKYLMDALQEIRVIENDNVTNYVECNIKVAGQDRENPRVEIIVEEVLD